MLTSISPLGEQARGNRWSLTVLWLTLGAAVGGAAVGSAFGAVGRIFFASTSDGVRLGVLALACAAASAWDLSSRRIPGSRQVNEDWLAAYRRWFYAAGFGLQLGAAVLTVVNTALVPLFLVSTVLIGDLFAGTAVGAVFGASRGVSLLASSRVRDPDDLRKLHRLVDQLADRIRVGGAGVAAALGLAASVILLTL
ncbi:MAG: hypothetical protein OXE79_05875 [Acidimicrobiaceae bacterium]|nr:hypothetical protein [Acidimicrobiaceae bacterium]MCY4280249.1 hypothetical protein [Acidimicrobiaceae bacterium]MCY4293569.1 hypothetical protein [Acidimicrobiaceae bacterium]